MLPNFLTIAVAFTNSKITPWTLDVGDNNTQYIRDAPVLTILSQKLGFKFKFLEATDGSVGDLLPDGNFTGIMGMLQREEVDMAFGKLSITESRAAVADFTFPYQYIPITFITDKPRSFPDKYAILYPFRSSVWIAVATSLMFIQLISYMLFKIKKYTFQLILLKLFGSLLEKSLNINLRKNSSKILVLSWILGAMMITFAYKAVFLSFLTFPSLTGIRDIEQLSKASEDSSFTCATYMGTKIYAHILKLGGETWQNVGKCLSRSEMHTDDVEGFLLQLPAQQKAFVGQKQHLSSFSKGYFVAEDSFFTALVGFGVRKSFCCKDILDKIIIRMASVGILDKFDSDEQFFFSLGKNYVDEHNPTRQLSPKDFAGAFIVLTLGLILSSLTLMFEVLFWLKLNKNK